MWLGVVESMIVNDAKIVVNHIKVWTCPLNRPATSNLTNTYALSDHILRAFKLNS